MNKISLVQYGKQVRVLGPVSYTIPQLVKYARQQGLQFTSYRVVSDAFTSKFRTFGIELIG